MTPAPLSSRTPVAALSEVASIRILSPAAGPAPLRLRAPAMARVAWNELAHPPAS